VQANLKRTADDNRTAHSEEGENSSCQGAYKETADIATARARRSTRAYLMHLETLFRRGADSLVGAMTAA